MKQGKKDISHFKIGLSATALLLTSAVIASRYLTIFRVKGDSMDPTICDNDMVLSLKSRSLGCGDIVTFRFRDMIFIKRIIGIAGDVIDMDGEGNVFVGGVMQGEPYVGKRSRGKCDIVLPCKVPKNSLFVMGDSREVSTDSRCRSVGCIRLDDVIGRVVFRISPLSRWGKIDQ